MEEKGFLTSFEKEVSSKLRKYYSITKEGRKQLEKKTEEWNAYTDAVTKVLTMGV